METRNGRRAIRSAIVRATKGREGVDDATWSRSYISVFRTPIGPSNIRKFAPETALERQKREFGGRPFKGRVESVYRILTFRTRR